MDEKDYTSMGGADPLVQVEGKDRDPDDHDSEAVIPNGELHGDWVPPDQILGDPPDVPAALDDEGDLDAEGEPDEESDRGECYWEDAYEQEV